MDETTLFSEIPITSDVAADVIDVAEEVTLGSMSGGIQNTPESDIWQMPNLNPIGESDAGEFI